MRYCTECGDEFQDWVQQCPDCHIPLVNGPKPEVENLTLNRDELVTIASYSHSEEAYVAHTKLQAEGILSFIADDYMVTMYWLYSLALGGVKIRVRESDAEAAIKILDSIPKELPEDNYEGARCPECNSVDITYQTFYLPPMSIVLLLTFLFLGGPRSGFILPFFKFKWKCNKCGHQWRNHK